MKNYSVITLKNILFDLREYYSETNTITLVNNDTDETIYESDLKTFIKKVKNNEIKNHTVNNIDEDDLIIYVEGDLKKMKLLFKERIEKEHFIENQFMIQAVKTISRKTFRLLSIIQSATKKKVNNTNTSYEHIIYQFTAQAVNGENVSGYCKITVNDIVLDKGGELDYGI